MFLHVQLRLLLIDVRISAAGSLLAKGLDLVLQLLDVEAFVRLQTVQKTALE